MALISAFRKYFAHFKRRKQRDEVVIVNESRNGLASITTSISAGRASPVRAIPFHLQSHGHGSLTIVASAAAQPPVCVKSRVVTVTATATDLTIAERDRKDSPFLRLPSDIRNKIYAYVFTGILYIDYIRQAPQCFHFPLLLTCRQIYQEAALLPFSLGTISSTDSSNFNWFVSKLSLKQRGVIETIHCKMHDVIDVHDFDEEGLQCFRCHMSLRQLPGLKSLTILSFWPLDEVIKKRIEEGLEECTGKEDLQVYFVSRY